MVDSHSLVDPSAAAAMLPSSCLLYTANGPVPVSQYVLTGCGPGTRAAVGSDDEYVDGLSSLPLSRGAMLAATAKPVLETSSSESMAGS